MSIRLHAFLKATALGLPLALVAMRSAHAVDGVIEINQVRAKAGGVTPGDTPLFPVLISQPGSYRLTGNLDVTDASARPGGTLAENTTAIQVTADDVTIDLNGFMIKGPTNCSGDPLMCTPTGSGNGIDAGSHVNVAAVNGTVRGMGHGGLALGFGRAEKVRASDNGEIGIQAVTVTDSTADGNGDRGILANLVTACLAEGNFAVGIQTIVATGCEARFNAAPQINAIGIVGHNICANAPCP